MIVNRLHSKQTEEIKTPELGKNKKKYESKKLDDLIKIFENACRETNSWETNKRLTFEKLFQKIEDLNTGHHLNAQQIGKIDTSGIRIFNIIPIDIQNRFFKFFSSTLDNPKVIDQLEEDALPCANFFSIVETLSNQENTAEAEQVLFKIKDVDLRLEMIRRYAKTQDILDNIAICQNKIIQKVLSYLELRGQNLYKDAIQRGLCCGLTLLYCYYQFLGKENEFYDRIKKMLSLDIKQSEQLTKKSYKGLSENERELEHFCNDVLFLHGFHGVHNLVQHSHVATLSFVTNQNPIKNLSSQLQFASCFSYDSITKSYSSLRRTLTQILQTDTNKSKFLRLDTGKHPFGIFYQNNKCYLYDSNDPFQRPSFEFDTKDPSIAIGKLADKISELFLKRYNSQKKTVALTIEVLANEGLIELQEKKETLFLEIDPGKNTTNYCSSSSTFEGQTPLHIAICNRFLNLVKVLIEKGADVNAVNINGRTPLMFAAQQGHLDLVKHLYEQGANIHKVLNIRATALYIAAENGNLDTVKYLRQQGANIHKSLNNGATPLLIAAQQGHLDIVEYLLKHGAIDTAANDGQTALSIAKKNGHQKCVEELEKHVASVSKKRKLILKTVQNKSNKKARISELLIS